MAGEIAQTAEFFVLGQTICRGHTRAFSGRYGIFFDVYRDKEIYAHNPFASIDQARWSPNADGYSTKTGHSLNVKAGHLWRARGNAASIAFCEELGLAM